MINVERRISYFSCLYLFICVVIIFETDHVLGQCVKKEKTVSQKRKEYLQNESSKSNTGFEFLLRNNIPLNLEKHDIFGVNKYAKIRRRKIPTFKLVQQFIRTVKGIPDIKPKTGTSNRIEDHSDKSNKCMKPEKFKLLIPVEIRIYHILKRLSIQMVKEYKPPLPLLESYLDDIGASTLRVIMSVHDPSYKGLDEMKKDPYAYIASNPILIYRMVRRLSEDLTHLLTYLESDNELIEFLYKYANMSDLTFPTSNDLTCVLGTLSQVQKQNEIKAYEVGKGEMKDINLNVLHSLELGAFYFKNGEYDYAVDWFRSALRKLRENALIIDFYPEFDLFCNEMHDLAISELNEDRKRKIVEKTTAEIDAILSKDLPKDSKGNQDKDESENESASGGNLQQPNTNDKKRENNKSQNDIKPIPNQCNGQAQTIDKMEPTMGMIDKPKDESRSSCSAKAVHS